MVKTSSVRDAHDFRGSGYYGALKDHPETAQGLYDGVSIVIPAYNEEMTLRHILEDMQAADLFEKVEVIVVNDGSTDKTGRVCAEYPLHLIEHETNRGYGAALKSGIRKARGERIVIMDSDGQHSLRYVPKILEMLDHYDMVIGQRDNRSEQSAGRDIGKRFIKFVGEFLVGQKLPDFNSGYRAFNRQLILKMLHFMPNGYSFSTTSTLAFSIEGYRIGVLPMIVEKRKNGTSNLSLFQDGVKTGLLVLRLIMLFNPLKIFFPASVLFSSLGFTYGSWSVAFGPRLANGAVTLMVLGMLLFFFGLLADQIAMFNRK